MPNDVFKNWWMSCKQCRPRSDAASDLDLHVLHEPMCSNILGKYRNLNLLQQQILSLLEP